MDLHNKKDNRIRKTAFMGLFLALAMICSYIETLIPFSVGIPGIKLGLANIAVVLMLYSVGTKEALLVSLLRIVLVGILFGNAFSILYSLSGGILSFLVMFLMKKQTNSVVFRLVSQVESAIISGRLSLLHGL